MTSGSQLEVSDRRRCNLPAVPVLLDQFTLRTAVRGDLPFLDQMQKYYGRQLGFLFSSAIEKKIDAGHVRLVQDSNHVPYGYCMAQPSYMSNDACGIIFQLVVVPLRQRKLVGASLIRDFFARSPYGMKLACCWCAQDLPANYFWESMGFIPLAFRTGSRSQQRIHIFWQRGVREGDTATPFWFPAKTGNGSIAEDRLVLPLPPGTRWQDAKPVLLPDAPRVGNARLLANGMPDPLVKRPARLAPPASKPTPAERVKRIKEKMLSSRGPIHRVVEELPEEVKPVRAKTERAKADPNMVSAAREFRDRYMDRFNDGSVIEGGKYSPARLLAEAPSVLRGLPGVEGVPEVRLLGAEKKPPAAMAEGL